MKSFKKGFLNLIDASTVWSMAFVRLAMMAMIVAVYVSMCSTSVMTTTLNQLLNQTQSLRTATGYGTGDLVPALIRSGSLPKDLSVVDNTLFFNTMGGSITVTGSGMGFIVATAGINEKDCMKLVTTLGNGDIASTRINSAAAMVGEISPAQASAACTAGKNNTVTFTTNM